MSATISHAQKTTEQNVSLQDSYEEELRENEQIKVTYDKWSVETHGFYALVALAILAITYLAHGDFRYIGPGILFIPLVALAHPYFLNGYKAAQRRTPSKGP